MQKLFQLNHFCSSRTRSLCLSNVFHRFKSKNIYGLISIYTFIYGFYTCDYFFNISIVYRSAMFRVQFFDGKEITWISWFLCYFIDMMSFLVISCWTRVDFFNHFTPIKAVMPLIIIEERFPLAFRNSA